jgi:hypothetical protein
MDEPRIVRHLQSEPLTPEQQAVFDERVLAWNASFADHERAVLESSMITEEDLRIVINVTDETFI